MLERLSRAKQQLEHLAAETRALTGEGWWRWGSVWFTDAFWTLASYRMSRAGYLALGRGWSVARIAIAPALYAVRPWSGRCEIHYRADIDRGLRVLHPTLGVVVSAKTVAGRNLTLVGGNCIGSRKDLEGGEIRIGHEVLLGANAIVLGPITVGDDVKIGAGAVVVHDVAAGDVVLAPLGKTVLPRPR
jgi:serine acetyltransferase